MNDIAPIWFLLLLLVAIVFLVWFVMCMGSIAHAARLYIKDYERRRKDRIAESEDDEDDEDDEDPPVRKKHR